MHWTFLIFTLTPWGEQPTLHRPFQSGWPGMARVAEEGEVLLEQVARVQKLPTLPAAILQVVLCIAQIGRLQLI